jgi:hypothetical protein
MLSSADFGLSISAPNRLSTYPSPRFLPFALRYFQPSSPQEAVAERDAVTGKLGNEKDKKKKVYSISV